MKKLLIMAVIIFAAYQAWGKFGTQFAPAATEAEAESYVAVYGRDSCSVTQQVLSDLQIAGVEYEYYSVDDAEVADILHAKMQAQGISTARYNLPVVDVNGAISVRPALQAILDKYHQ